MGGTGMCTCAHIQGSPIFLQPRQAPAILLSLLHTTKCLSNFSVAIIQHFLPEPPSLPQSMEAAAQVKLAQCVNYPGLRNTRAKMPANTAHTVCVHLSV